MTIDEIIISIICSVIASFVFWILTFRISRTKVLFSECIEKSSDVFENPDDFRYRVKLINVKRTDLIDVSFIVRFSVSRGNTNSNTFLQLGYPASLPVLHGKKWQMKNKERFASWCIPIKMTNSAYEEFSKEFYPPSLRNKAKERTLTLYDIFEQLHDQVKLTIYTFGYDALTGARRLFQSKSYTSIDVVEGHFKSPCHYYTKYSDYVSHILQIESNIE